MTIIPLTPQPEETKKEITLLPDKPKRKKGLSKIKATRDIYPQSSKRQRRKNNKKTCGTKVKTVPTPAKIPSKIKLLSHPYT